MKSQEGDKVDLYFDLDRTNMIKLLLQRHVNKILRQNNQELTIPGPSRSSHIHSITISGQATHVNGVPGRRFIGDFTVPSNKAQKPGDRTVRILPYRDSRSSDTVPGGSKSCFVMTPLTP